MDDDIITAIIFFFVIMLAICLATNAYIASIESIIYPEVLVLLNDNIINKQIVAMPTTVAGIMPGNPPPTFVCYVYNPHEYAQNVTIIWWLSYQLPKEYVTISGYNGSFILYAGNVTELVLSWSLDSQAPISVLDKFREAGSSLISFDVIPELME